MIGSNAPTVRTIVSRKILISVLHKLQTIVWTSTYYGTYQRSAVLQQSPRHPRGRHHEAGHLPLDEAEYRRPLKVGPGGRG
jgi:hypothetical protein